MSAWDRLERGRLWVREHERGLALAAIVVVLLLGAWTRLCGYFDEGLGLWLDEAWWGKRAIRGELHYRLRPEGFMWLIYKISQWRATDQTLRLPSLLASLLSLPLMLAVLRQVSSSRWLPIFGLYLFALHRVAMAMAKELKPYSLELFLHVALLYCAWRWFRRGSRNAFALACLVAPLTFWFAWSVIFLFPALFLLLAWGAVRRRGWLELGAACASALLTLYVVFHIYDSRLAESEPKTSYWAEKYGVFFTGQGEQAQTVWYLKQLVELFAFPSHLKFDSVDLIPVALATFAVVCAIAAVATALVTPRKWPIALTTLSPFLVMIAISLQGRWPFGVFRTNTFTLAYSLPLVVVGAEALHRRLRKLVSRPHRAQMSLALVAGMLLLIVGSLPFAPGRFAVKERGDFGWSTGVRVALEDLLAWEESQGALRGGEVPEERTVLLLDQHACSSYYYYIRYHSDLKVETGPLAEQLLEDRCQKIRRRIRRALRRGEPFWILTSRPGLGEELRKRLRPCDLVVDESYPVGTSLYRCEPRPKAKRGRRKRAR